MRPYLQHVDTVMCSWHGPGWCCRYDSTSRYHACLRLRGDIDDAREMAVASGLLRTSALPRSCAGLKRPEQLLQMPEQWSISWTDTPLQDRKSGLIR